MNSFKQKFRLLILNFFYPLTVFLGNLHLPFTRKRMTGQDLLDIQKKILVGDAIVTKAYGEFSMS